MASFKVKYRPSSRVEREGRIFYQIIHERTTRQVVTDLRILDVEWNEELSEVECRAQIERGNHIENVRERIKADMNRFDSILRRLEKTGTSYTTEDIVKEFCINVCKVSLFNEMEKGILRLKEHGRLRTAQAYSSTMRSFCRFRNDKDIYLDSMTSEVMEGYQAWLLQQGVAPNTVSFYIRIIRAVYNRAVEEDLTENRRPFRHVYTGVDKTAKRGLPLHHLRKIRLLDLSHKPELDYARDMFILSYMLRGMSFIDMAYLKKSDLCNGYITYRRRKTRQQLTISWTTDMQKIIDKYPTNTSDYLLPIIRKTGRVERYVYKNTGERINHGLKKIAEMAGIGIPLTMYVARHTWASLAKAKGIPLSIISEGLGHEKESTTRIYLSNLDSSALDKANDLMLKLI